ncbi:BatD family protein [Microbulbifer agarilyticus]|uniref:BatD family protein n=1 Tax=Microbulbifer agarilyticus TaxID=260552 RepID=UPI001C98ABDD|nr:BatD family protein [Microbulbifer agarilyticus]MBY6211929.1 BatD family protein [Microbulbifer agarilyticus]
MIVLTTAVTIAAQTDTPSDLTSNQQVDNKPIVQSALSQSDIAPGQAVTFRVTVLVPTWLSRPIEFPQFDSPNLSVTQPEKSTVSTSQTINGKTWSGVTREYQVVPLTPGTFQLPLSSLEVHYRSPQNDRDIVTNVPLPAQTLTVTAPKGAEDLRPYIAARDLTLTQKIDGEPDKLRPGDSFSRTVTATIQGSTVMFIPLLQNQTNVDGIAAYPDTPQAIDHSDFRDSGTGKRTEKVTFVAEAPTRGELPAITLRWYDLDDGSIQTASVDALKIRVKGASVVRSFSLAQWLLVLALTGLALWLGKRWLPALAQHVRTRYLDYREASGQEVLARLRKAAKKRDYTSALVAAVELEHTQDYITSDIPAALLALGRARYGDTAATETDMHLWQRFELAIDAYAAQRSASTRKKDLPPLNPHHQV